MTQSHSRDTNSPHPARSSCSIDDLAGRRFAGILNLLMQNAATR